MSNEKVEDARLEGYEGPFFPPSLEEIQRRYSHHPQRFNDLFFGDLADRLHSGTVTKHPVTSDEPNHAQSPWDYGVSFVRHGAEYQILFPRLMDHRRLDGTYSTRHVAAYVKGELPDGELAKVTREFVETFNSEYRLMYPHSTKNPH